MENVIVKAMGIFGLLVFLISVCDILTQIF